MIRRIRLGWDLWDSHWRKSLIDSESAHLDLVHRPHPDENHGSVIRPAARDALALHLGRLAG